MTTTEQTKSKRKRYILIGLGLAVVIAGAMYAYLTSGRYISTENAYIEASKIMISPEVAGKLVAVNVRDNQDIKKGDQIFEIDPTPYQIKVAKAEAELATARSRVEDLKARYRQKSRAIEQAEIDSDYARREYMRREGIKNKSVIPATEISEYKNLSDKAVKSIEVLKEEKNQILAQLENNPDIPVEEHSDYKAARAELKQAQLDLKRTKVRAPIEGIIGQAPNVGDYARAGVPLVNLIGAENRWIEANYKETSLTRVVPGQPVEIEVDTYPDKIWRGSVESISPASGSEFSVLPAQNSSGNWVKVVQRIPVRIAIENYAGAQDAPPLRAGMSTRVTIDTGRFPHLPQSDR